MSNRVLFATLLACSILSACGTSKHLGSEWKPLERIRESTLLAPSKTGARTIGKTVYVYNLKNWLRLHPEPRYSAILKHEQVHSRRMLDYKGGVPAYGARYVSDSKFMWAEEQLGWYEEIVWRRAHGVRVDPRSLGHALHENYKILGREMVSEKDAMEWVGDVLRGRWKPED